tara:strand:+ start:12360 stop:12533 length:174 start_codon:yes stop_codon:yes gene_type:complete
MMKVGDLVRHSFHKKLGIGIITNIKENGLYYWVFFSGWQENTKWCYYGDLEIVSECR